MREYVRDQVKAVPLFDGVSPHTFEQLVPLMDCVEIDQAGTHLITEGKVRRRRPDHARRLPRHHAFALMFPARGRSSSSRPASSCGPPAPSP